MNCCFYSSRPKEEQYLVSWATPQLHDRDSLGRIADPALRGLYPPESLSRFADVIALCVQVYMNVIYVLDVSWAVSSDVADDLAQFDI